MIAAFKVPSPRVPPARPEARDHPAMEEKGATRFGSRYHLHVGTGSHQIIFITVRAIRFREACAAPIALCLRARRLKFSRMSQGLYWVGATKLVSHVCNSACSATGRCAWSGWRRARMMFLAVMEGKKVRSTILKIPQRAVSTPSYHE